MKKQSFLRGAATIAVGGFAAKLIGALYRIPLLSLVGGECMGAYQLVYPFYCLLLTVSATGIPSSVAKIAAEKTAKGESDESVLRSAFQIFLLLGGAGTLLMVLLSPVLSSAQGVKEIRSGYIALAPSVFLTSAISVFRGWFQGRNDMRPTALSEITEQLVKVAFGLLFAYLYRGNVARTVTALLFAVSLSELVTLFLLIFCFRRTPAPFQGLEKGGRFPIKKILSLSLPVTFSSAVTPLCSFFESAILTRLLGRYTQNPVALYGLFAGGALTIAHLPTSICYGVAVASVPSVAAENAKSGDKKAVRKKVFFAFGVSFFLSSLFAAGLVVFSKPLVNLVYGGLSSAEKETLIKLVKILSLSGVFLSCAQTLSACLTAQGKPKHSAVSFSVGATVRLALDFLLVRNRKFSVFGAAIAVNIGYLVAFFLDLVYNIFTTRNNGEKSNGYGSQFGDRSGRFDESGRESRVVGEKGIGADGAHAVVSKRYGAGRAPRNARSGV